MTVTFSIEYWAQPHERLTLVGRAADSPAHSGAQTLPLEHLGEGHWQATLHLPSATSPLHYIYSYRLTDETGAVLREEWRIPHELHLPTGDTAVFTQDRWIDCPEDAPAFSAAFCDILGLQAVAPEEAPQPGLTFSVHTPALRRLVTGSCEALGSWDPQKALSLTYCGQGRWSATLPASAIGSAPTSLRYKYLLSTDAGYTYLWEEGEDRWANLPDSTIYPYCYVQDSYLHLPSRPVRTAGLVAPLFSLRSDTDWGIGDFGALREAIDFAAEAGMHAVQLLPINDTTSTRGTADSYPYNAISVDALHPIYIDPEALPALPTEERKAFLREAKALRQLPAVDYPRVLELKERFLRRTFELQGKADLTSEDFRLFYDEAAAWLRPYALYCVLRDQFGSGTPSDWAGWEAYDEAKAAAYLDDAAHAEEVGYYYWLQFVLDRQLQAVRSYAEERGVFLKGDLPIGVAPHSVDVWVAPHLFHTEQSAGAPPDDFAADGQNWGFPTYNWERMQDEGDFRWWRQRFERQARYFHAFRIDHILGFFRIWEVPLEYVRGLCGHFRPALPLTPDEIEAFGLPFDVRYTRPMIRRECLAEVFGDKSDEVLARFLTSIDDTYLAPNALCDTQQKIAALFQNTNDIGLRDALYRLTEEVLFVEDPYTPGHYHPRISADRSLRYHTLSEAHCIAFDRLYTDFFFVRHHDFWRDTALRRLHPLTASTDMLVCGEDLGMIPDSVHEVMDRLRILSLELGRISKIYGVEFTDLRRAPYLSVCTTSTHDMAPLRLWWQEDAERTHRYMHALSYPTHNEEATPEAAECIVRDHLQAASILTVLPLQDWLAIDGSLRAPDPTRERINIPADPDHYWRYRMHLTLEELLGAEAFNKKIGAMLRESNRTD